MGGNIAVACSGIPPDVYVSGLANVEHIGGGNFRFTFYAIRGSGWHDAVSIVVPTEAIPQAIVMTAKEVGIKLSATIPNSPLN